MSDTYAITIEAIQGRTLRARVHLLNFQYPEVPANKCLAMQHLADAVTAQVTPPPGQGPEQGTAARADARLVALARSLHARHDAAFHQALIAQAEVEFLRVVELEWENFDKAADWHARNEAGSPDLLPFRDLGLTQLLELEVADPRWLDHLAVGSRWDTAMYARDERHGA
jgi:hypothetical protein